MHAHKHSPSSARTFTHAFAGATTLRARQAESHGHTHTALSQEPLMKRLHETATQHAQHTSARISATWPQRSLKVLQQKSTQRSVHEVPPAAAHTAEAEDHLWRWVVARPPRLARDLLQGFP